MSRPNKSGRIFYGWYIVAGATSVIFISTATSVFGPSVLLKPMIAELGWSRTDFFAAQAMAAIVGGLAAPFVGRRIDRGNARLLILAGAVAVTASVTSYSQVHSLWLYLLLAGIITPAALSMCGSQVFNAVVAKWFVRKRGRALATSQAGLNLGGIIVSPSLVVLIALLGWRMTWVAVGLAVLVFIVPVSLLVKRSPEDMGLKPDGEIQPPANGPVSPPRQEPEWKWPELRRSGAFWMITIVFGLTGMSTAGSGLHTYPFLTDRNIPPALAATMISAISISGLAFRPLLGYILEHWDLRHAALLAFSTMALSIVGLLFTTNVPALFASLAVRGVGTAVVVTLAPMFCGHYFGRRNIGEVLGLSHLIGLPFSAAGPVLAAWMFDRLHSYTVVFSTFAAIFLLCAVAIFRIYPPVTRPAAIPASRDIPSR